MYSDAETLPENKKRGGASMRGQFENSLGTVSIDSEVVATYAGEFFHFIFYCGNQII